MKQSGDRLGRFTISRVLGEGVRSTSYLTFPAGKGRRPSSVLKLLGTSSSRTQSSRSFRDLLRADTADLVSLAHPSLSLPHDFGFDAVSECAYLVRSFIAGADFLTATRTLSARRQLSWLVAAAEALSLIRPRKNCLP